jgi:hypothetical protein
VKKTVWQLLAKGKTPEVSKFVHQSLRPRYLMSHVLLHTAPGNQPPKLLSQKEARTSLGYVRPVGGLYHFQVKICLTEDGWHRRQGKFSVLGHSSSIHTCSSLISTLSSRSTNQKPTQTKGDKPSKAKDDDGDDEGDQSSDGGKAKDSAKPTPKKVRFFAYDTSSLLTPH